jgi:hypothetical protein
MADNEQPPTETETTVEMTSRPQVDALPDYSPANVAGTLVASSQMAICHIPACTSQFFEHFANKPSGPQESRFWDPLEKPNTSGSDHLGKSRAGQSKTSRPVPKVLPMGATLLIGGDGLTLSAISRHCPPGTYIPN